MKSNKISNTFFFDGVVSAVLPARVFTKRDGSEGSVMSFLVAQEGGPQEMPDAVFSCFNENATATLRKGQRVRVQFTIGSSEGQNGIFFPTVIAQYVYMVDVVEPEERPQRRGNGEARDNNYWRQFEASRRDGKQNLPDRSLYGAGGRGKRQQYAELPDEDGFPF